MPAIDGLDVRFDRQWTARDRQRQMYVALIATVVATLSAAVATS